MLSIEPTDQAFNACILKVFTNTSDALGTPVRGLPAGGTFGYVELTVPHFVALTSKFSPSAGS
jgi:hypothetical protein